MASPQDPVQSAATFKRTPLESMSWGFVDTKPGIIKYDVKHTHVLTIGNFSKKMETEPFIWLEEFAEFSIKIGEEFTGWILGICPNGYPRLNGTIGHTGVVLIKITDTEFPIDVDLIFSFVDKNGSKSRIRRGEMTFQAPAGEGRFKIRKFISHSELRENRDLIPDDTLTIMCELTIKGGGVSLVDGGPSILAPGGNEERSTRNITENMEEVFKVAKFTDVTIDCQGKQFPCHKAILAGRSPVFDAMFSPNFKEGIENKVEVVDVSADILEEILHFIYSGEVRDLNKQRTKHLLIAAEKYNLVDLKLLCEESLCINMTVENVLDLIEIADLHDAANLRATALKFIGKNAKQVAAQKGWREKIPDVMADIFEAIIQKGD